MASNAFDAIVIGAGHNGLAAATALAARGKRVCVLERSETVGGMAANAELAPGVTGPRLAHLLYNLSESEQQRLGLGAGRAVELRPLDTVSLSPDGGHVVIRGGRAEMADGSAHPQSAAFAALHTRLCRYAALLSQLADAPPPGFDGGLTSLAGLRQMARLAKLGLGFKRMGKAEMRECLRILLSNAHDLLLDELDDGPLAGAMAADAVRGAYAGPRSPGTVFSLMYRLGTGGAVALPVGGMGAVTGAYAGAAKAAGVEIRTDAAVARVTVAEDRVTGVELQDGTRLEAAAVLSSAGPLQTMQMAGVAHFDIEAARRARNLRCKGSAAKINIVLRAAPEFDGLGAGQNAARLIIAPSVTYVERAFNPAKYGDVPKAPAIELVIPSLTDPSMAGAGRHVLSVVVTHVPSEPKAWTAAARDRLLKTATATIAQYAPGFEKLIESAEVLTPPDIAALTGAPGGHWHHAEMGLDQILTLRPTAGTSRYRFAVHGLYLCGASAHPGGDVTGAPGRNSAAQVLADGVL